MSFDDIRSATICCRKKLATARVTFVRACEVIGWFEAKTPTAFADKAIALGCCYPASREENERQADNTLGAKRE